MKKPLITVSTSIEETLHEAAKVFVRTIEEAARKKERVSVALSGGNTPSGLFLLLSDRSESYFPQIPWSQIDFFWSDERFVPATDENSNFRMAKKTLLERVPVDATRVHRVITENVTPEESAQGYQRDLQNFFKARDLSNPPAFDLILLGLGPDGHTASLFPDAPLAELDHGPFSDCWVKSFFVPHLKKEQPIRISFTPKLINASSTVIFLVTGADKAQAFDRVVHSDDSPYLIPAKLIQPKSGNLIWIIDQEVSARQELAS
jgi:6-phosphogluconolactonase